MFEYILYVSIYKDIKYTNIHLALAKLCVGLRAKLSRAVSPRKWVWLLAISYMRHPHTHKVKKVDTTNITNDCSRTKHTIIIICKDEMSPFTYIYIENNILLNQAA